MNGNRNIPTILVLFGITGDLVERKITPALFHLFRKGRLPDMFRIVGFARRPISQPELRKMMAKQLKKAGVRTQKKELDAFLKIFSYRQSQFDDVAGYRELAGHLRAIDQDWGMCSNKLFYLAVPPSFYETIFKHLKSSGLSIPCGTEMPDNAATKLSPGKRMTISPDDPKYEMLSGWTRIIVEKPFGKNLSTARKLDRELGNLFKEDQIYRIDHYLAKELIRNILTLRFSNTLFEQSWNSKFIEKVEIKLLEKIGVEERGDFYDTVGALRDIGQNHLLQMLALVAMDNPGDSRATAVRKKRADILKKIRPLTPGEVKKHTYRGQYKSYRKIEGVYEHSKTETYFKVSALIHSRRWAGVPFIIEGGKKLSASRKEIVVTFKHPVPCLCPPETKEHFKNRVVFSLEPREEISIQFRAKQPGLEMELADGMFSFALDNGEHISGYERLLLDCIAGDQTLFVGSDEIRATWKFIDPITEAWENDAVPMDFYEPGEDAVRLNARKVDESV